MKPPPRKRTKVDRNIQPESRPRRSCPWTRAEQTKLLGALRRLSRTTGDKDLDYGVLVKALPTRSVSQLRFVVDSLKNRVISWANLKLKRMKWEERRARKPIQEWTHLASAVAGTREETITTAFSQMFIVSSTEPRTLRNCDPPQVHRPPSDKDRLVGRTMPLRPMPRTPVQARPLEVLRTPAATRAPMVRIPNSTLTPPRCRLSADASPAAEADVPVTPSTALQPASRTVTPVTAQVTPTTDSAVVVETQSVGASGIQTTQQPSEQRPSIISTSTSPSPPVPLSAACSPPVPPPSVTCSSPAGSSHPTPPPSTSAAELHTSKHATKDSPRMSGVKSVVDFQRIYRYLSAIHKPTEECHLTPMESAVLLDLLMSLPEELALLDCSKLQKHLIQVYGCLTSRADSKVARTMCKDLKESLCSTTGATKGRDSHRRNAASKDDRETRPQPDEAESQSSGIDDPSSQSADADLMGLCPPLNPFMVPLKLLARKQVGGQRSKTNVQ